MFTPRPARWAGASSRCALFLACSSLLSLVASLANSPLLGPFAARRLASNPISDPGTNASKPSTDFRWDSITPSEELVYKPCYGEYQCARLSVPVDWNATAAGGPRVAIALIKIPAKVSVTDPRYGGALLTNPGGPGGSGIYFILEPYGKLLRTIVDSDELAQPDKKNQKYFDFISWDPRGINNTTPAIIGLPSDGFQQLVIENQAIGTSLEIPEVLGKVFARNTRYGQIVASNAASANASSIGKFVTATQVARDMVEIVERLGQWREKEAAKSGKVPDRLKWQKGKELLQFWGFSYGSYIAQVFATLYPDRVGRIVPDGVADGDDLTKVSWTIDVIDDDKITANFSAACDKAGPARCPFSGQKLEALADQLETDPVLTSSPDYVQIATRSDLYATLLDKYYNGFAGFKRLGTVLGDLARGSGDALAAGNLEAFTCPPEFPFDRDIAAVQYAILCTDGTSLNGQSKAAFEAKARFLTERSKIAGPVWAPITAPCYAYNVTAASVYLGPFGARTKNPLLFGSQTLDPVCPLRSAQKAQRLFPGSGLVESQGIGHCVPGYPNACALGVIREYFRTGKVRAYTACPPVAGLFQDAPNITTPKDGNEQLVQVAVEIAKRWPD